MSADETASATDVLKPARLNLFEAFGVELEYMIVDRASLDVMPVTDRLIEAESGLIQSEIDLGKISWSNELALHVVELKTTAPEADLTLLADDFQAGDAVARFRAGEVPAPGRAAFLGDFPQVVAADSAGGDVDEEAQLQRRRSRQRQTQRLAGRAAGPALRVDAGQL